MSAHACTRASHESRATHACTREPEPEPEPEPESKNETKVWMAGPDMCLPPGLPTNPAMPPAVRVQSVVAFGRGVRERSDVYGRVRSCSGPPDGGGMSWEPRGSEGEKRKAKVRDKTSGSKVSDSEARE